MKNVHIVAPRLTDYLYQKRHVDRIGLQVSMLGRAKRWSFPALLIGGLAALGNTIAETPIAQLTIAGLVVAAVALVALVASPGLYLRRRDLHRRLEMENTATWNRLQRQKSG